MSIVLLLFTPPGAKHAGFFCAKGNMDFTITAQNNIQPFTDIAYKGAAKTYSFDFNPWAEDNHDVTSVTWDVQSGQAAISGQALVANVASALVTFAEEGGNLIKITATTSAEKYVVYLDVPVKDLLLATELDGGVYV